MATVPNEAKSLINHVLVKELTTVDNIYKHSSLPLPNIKPRILYKLLSCWMHYHFASIYTQAERYSYEITSWPYFILFLHNKFTK